MSHPVVWLDGARVSEHPTAYIFRVKVYAAWEYYIDVGKGVTDSESSNETPVKTVSVMLSLT
jgi:hypothetical protein